MAIRRSLRSRASPEDSPSPPANMRTRSTRQTRSSIAPASVTVSRPSPDSSSEPGRFLRLTLKMPAGKLREATGGRSGRRSVNVFQENPIVSGPRSSRNRKKVVEFHSSDEDEDVDDQEEDEVDDEDAPGEDDEDADGDVDMEDAPPQPPARRVARPQATRGNPPKSVEAKEMDLEEEEEEEDNVSVTDSDAEGEPDDQDDSAVPDINVDDLDEEDEEDDLDEELDSDAFALDGGKQTNRQRRNLGDDFLQLPMEPQVKKHLTAEERAMRRAEMARRRKNLSEKRNEEEKMDTINRLLRKQPPNGAVEAPPLKAPTRPPLSTSLLNPRRQTPR